MPVVLVELGPFILALLAAVCAIAADFLIKAIGNAIGKVGIGPVTWNIGAFFVGKADAIVSWALDNGKQYFQDLANWVTGHEYLFRTFAGAVVAAVNHLGDQIAHIVNTSIPNAISAAEAAAGKHAQELVNGVEKDLTADYNKLTSALAGDVKTIDGVISKDVTDLTNLVSKSVSAGVSTAEKYADNEIGDLRNYVDDQIGKAEGIAAAALASAVKTIGSQIANAASTAHSELVNAESTLEADISAAAKTAAANLSTAEQAIGGEISTVASQAAQEVAGAEAQAQAEVTSLGSSLASTISADVGTLTGDITGTAQALEGDLSSLQTVLEAAISGAIAGVLTRVAKLEECSVGVCDDSPNNFSSLLQDALGIADFAAFAVFVAGAINSPGQAADEFETAAKGLYSDADSLLDSLLSL
jgi:hypothetical protein